VQLPGAGSRKGAPNHDSATAVFNSRLHAVFTVLLIFSLADVESTFSASKKLKFALVSPKYEAAALNRPLGVALSPFQPVGFMPFSFEIQSTLRRLLWDLSSEKCYAPNHNHGDFFATRRKTLASASRRLTIFQPTFVPVAVSASLRAA